MADLPTQITKLELDEVQARDLSDSGPAWTVWSYNTSAKHNPLTLYTRVAGVSKWQRSFMAPAN